MNKNTLLLITSDKMILKINYLKITFMQSYLVSGAGLEPATFGLLGQKLPTAPSRYIILKNTTCFHK